MWNRLGIKFQLILFMTLVVTLVEISTLAVVHNMKLSENEDNAVLEARTITKSLNNDFLKVILNPNADAMADISYRLSAFKKVNGVILYDENAQALFRYGKIEQIKKSKQEVLIANNLFTPQSLLVKSDLLADNYALGFTLMDIDLSEYKRQQELATLTAFAILPFALLLGLIISLYLSRSYTRPFSQLIKAMKKSDPTNGKILEARTSAKNEIKELFDGFNALMRQVSSSTQKLHFQIEHDPLTNIKNRFYMEGALQTALLDETCQNYDLLYLNLDQFKLINDAAGYQAGDELLKMLVDEYSKIIPKNSIFARVDGDAFMVLLKDSNKEEGLEFLQKSVKKLNDFRFVWENEAYSVSASIGLVQFQPFQYTLKELIKIANSSLYSAKAMGRNKFYVFNPEDDVALRLNRELETSSFIKEALSNGPSKFELFAQAIVPLQYKSDKVSYEILIRMWDKENNFVAPDDFLPTAQKHQLMAEIDIFVLWSYLNTVTQHPEHIENLHSVHINLAGSSLTNPDFQAKVKEAIVHFNFPWSKLELEVTETSAVGNFNKANEFIIWLKNIGVGLALDDFGTGMASFEYLKSMPFDVVKIDGSFVKDMHTDPIDKAVIKYIHEISALKGQETVAEYVETQEDVDELTKIGITYGQGYFLGKPKPLSQWL